AAQAHALAARLARIPGCAVAFDRPFLDRFPLRTPVGALYDALLADGIVVGLGLRDDPVLADALVLQCTELTTDQDIDAIAGALERAVAGAREPARA
ncbi:MAG: glycine dehydrogenase, partial [Chloroflexi bacterium]|nr:glycine dehydrogenase [Chloroflexota bacterium]